MTELIGFAALAAGGYWIMKRVKRKMVEAERHLSQTAAKSASKQTGERLVLDPDTGRYRPEGA